MTAPDVMACIDRALALMSEVRSAQADLIGLVRVGGGLLEDEVISYVSATDKAGRRLVVEMFRELERRSDQLS